MSRQVGSLRKGLLADGTLVGLFPVMRTKMRFECRLSRVGLSADVAGVVAWERIFSSYWEVLELRGLRGVTEGMGICGLSQR